MSNVIHFHIFTSIIIFNESLRAKGPPLVGEEVRKKDVAK